MLPKIIHYKKRCKKSWKKSVWGKRPTNCSFFDGLCSKLNKFIAIPKKNQYKSEFAHKIPFVAFSRRRIKKEEKKSPKESGHTGENNLNFSSLSIILFWRLSEKNALFKNYEGFKVLHPVLKFFISHRKLKHKKHMRGKCVNLNLTSWLISSAAVKRVIKYWLPFQTHQNSRGTSRDWLALIYPGPYRSQRRGNIKKNHQSEENFGNFYFTMFQMREKQFQKPNLLQNFRYFFWYYGHFFIANVVK